MLEGGGYWGSVVSVGEGRVSEDLVDLLEGEEEGKEEEEEEESESAESSFCIWINEEEPRFKIEDEDEAESEVPGVCIIDHSILGHWASMTLLYFPPSSILTLNLTRCQNSQSLLHSHYPH